MKEIKFGVKIAEHDFQTKLRAIRRLLAKDKVKVQVFFRGREITHPDIGINLLNRIVDEINDISHVESRLEKGDRYFLILEPGSK